MITDRSERSFSPLGKDPKSIGKFFKLKRTDQQNPQLNTSASFLKNQLDNRQRSPRSIGINTSKAALTAIPIIAKPGFFENQNQVKPVTHIKFKSPVIKVQPVSNNKQKKADKSVNNSFVLMNQNLVPDRVPAIVDFPIAYYEENQQSPETPDLPNRMNNNQNPHTQVTKQAPINPPKKVQKQVNTQYSQLGIIRHQNERVFSNSAPKDFGMKTNQSFHISSPQLPYINKIQNNIQGFRKFVNTNQASAQVASSTQINSNPSKNYYELTKKLQANSSLSSNNSSFIPRKSAAKSIGQILKKNQRGDPQQEQKLQQKKNFRISNNNFYANKMKLPTFRQQNKEQFEQQVNLDASNNPIHNKVNKRQQNFDLNLNNLNKPKNFVNEQFHKSSRVEKVEKNLLSNSINQNFSYQQEDCQQGSLISNSFIRNTAEVQSQNLLIVDLRTSIQKIKQALIQGGEQMAVTFNIPEVFYRPPTSLSTSQQLHLLMLQVFSYIGVNPQIVSIKKYINCVVMREKKLCILWNFNGKIYFGGWKKQQTMSQGNKDGIGIQWVPSRYVYYGQFKDNKKQGYGLMKKSNKQIYIGCWKNNQRWGWGRVYDHNGNLHQNGEFIQGCFVYPKSSFNQSGVREAR